MKRLWDLAVSNPHALQVYQNVPLQDLTLSGRERPKIDPSLENLCFSHVLCHGTKVYLAVTPWDTFGNLGRNSPRLDEASIPGLLVVKNTQTIKYQAAVRTKLQEREESKPEPAWQYCPHVIPREEWSGFCYKWLLEPWQSPDLPEGKGLSCRPTDYGLAMGISAGYGMDVNGAVRCLPVCPKDRIAALKAPWSGGGTEYGGKVPLVQRIQRLNQGMPGDPGCARTLIRQMAGMSLEDYMAGLPHQLESLLTALQVDGSCSIWEAARLVDRLLASDQEKGLDMLWNLCCAVELTYRKRRVRG